MLVIAALLSASHPSMAGGSPFPEIPGWRLTGAPVIYTPENLWDFIDGAAESYLAYAFVECRVGEYVNPDGVTVRVELYRHADPDNAFGIYATERAPDHSFLEIGAQGYQEEGILNFLAGPYYVKLSTHQRGAGADAGLRTIAGRVDDHLAEGSALPEGLRRFPGKGKQPHTEGFVAQNFLGYSFLHHAFTARYENGLQVFVMEYPTADSAAAALRNFLRAAPGNAIGPDRYSMSDPNNGPISVSISGRILYGIVGAPDTAVESKYLSLLEDAIRQH